MERNEFSAGSTSPSGLNDSRTMDGAPDGGASRSTSTTGSFSPMDGEAPAMTPQGDALVDRAKEAASGAREKLGVVASAVRERAGDAREGLANVLDAGADRIEARTGGGDLAAAGVGGGAMALTESRAARVAGGMHTTADFIRDADLDIEGLKKGIEKQVREHPARTLIIAAGLGYLLGKAFRK